MSEHRKFTRVQFVARAELEKDGLTFDGDVVDLSLKGILLKTEGENELTELDDILLTLILSETLKLEFSARVVHQHENLYGLKFVAEDLDSFTHLRRVCELNAHDPDKITEELSFLLES